MDIEGNCHFNPCDLLDFDEDLFSTLAADPSVKVLFVSAGFGRIADFQYHHIAEIERMLNVDTVSTLKVFSIFYNRILSQTGFYAGVMGSIAGWMSSPSASVYAAAKAAVVRFVESVNIELEVSGTGNRILDVSPASLKGTHFYGGKNELSITEKGERIVKDSKKAFHSTDTQMFKDFSNEELEQLGSFLDRIAENLRPLTEE